MKEGKYGTRRMQYERILAADGYTLKDCVVLSFDFGSARRAYAFHYDLMNYRRNLYYFFDLYDEGAGRVNVITSKSAEDAAELRRLAEANKGQERTPTI